MYKTTLQSYAYDYAFGMLQADRHYTFSEEYKFGFNGKEMENDWNGKSGAVYDYGFRIYDARIAKFLSVDPLFIEYPELTTYQFASNTPIWAIDLDGLEARYTNDGKFIGWGKIKGPDAPVEVVTTVTTKTIWRGKTVERKWRVVITLTMNGNPITYSEFTQLAAFVYNEENDTRAQWGVASAVVNRFKEMGGTIQKVLNSLSGYANDTKEKRYQRAKNKNLSYAEYIDTSPEKRNQNNLMRNATAGAINALTGGVDYSNGGTGWHGRDILPSVSQAHFEKTGKHWSAYEREYLEKGFVWEENAHINGKIDKQNLPNNNGISGKASYKITGSEGNSIFYKKNQ